MMNTTNNSNAWAGLKAALHSVGAACTAFFSFLFMLVTVLLIYAYLVMLAYLALRAGKVIG